jgi:hypothetical protein
MGHEHLPKESLPSQATLQDRQKFRIHTVIVMATLPKIGNVVLVLSDLRGNVAEMRLSDLRQQLPLSDLVKHIGFRFKRAALCQQ